MIGFTSRPLTLTATVIALCTSGFLFCACKGGGSQDPNKLTAKYNQAFASADPQTKGMWDLAADAVKTNGYVVGMQALQTLLQQPSLTPDQTKAAQETVTALNDRMYEAANKGDSVAKDAIDELRKIRGR